jgi:hypothetical protein
MNRILLSLIDEVENTLVNATIDALLDNITDDLIDDAIIDINMSIDMREIVQYIRGTIIAAALKTYDIQGIKLSYAHTLFMTDSVNLMYTVMHRKAREGFDHPLVDVIRFYNPTCWVNYMARVTVHVIQHIRTERLTFTSKDEYIDSLRRELDRILKKYNETDLAYTHRCNDNKLHCSINLLNLK